MKKNIIFIFCLLIYSVGYSQHNNNAGGLTAIFQSGSNECEDLNTHYPLYVEVSRCYDSLGNYCANGTLEWFYRRVSQNPNWQPLSANWNNYGDNIEKQSFENYLDSGEIRVVFTDTNLFTADTFDINVFFKPLPRLYISQDSINCSGIWYHAVDLNNLSGIGNSYDWDCDGTADPNISVYSASATLNAGADVYVCVKNSYGCSSSYYETGWGNDDYLYDINPNIVLYNTTFCAGTEYFSLERNNGLSGAMPSGSWSYEWFYNGNIIPNSNVYNYYPRFTGNYYVRITNSLGCQFTTNPISVTVLHGPASTINPVVDSVICPQTPVTLTVNCPASIYTEWYKNNVFTGFTGSTYTAIGAGRYKARTYGSNWCGQFSPATIISDYKNRIQAYGPTTFCAGSSVDLISTVNDATSSYQWIRNNAIIMGATSNTFNVTQRGFYKVVSQSIDGCSDTSNTIRIIVNCRMNNNENIGDNFSAQIIPNPNNGQFLISFIDNYSDEPIKIKISDINGKLVETTEYLPSIDGGFQYSAKGDLPNGLYLVQFEQNGEVYTTKLSILK